MATTGTQAVASGPAACHPLAALHTKIAADTSTGRLTAGQTSTLTESLSLIGSELGC